MSKRGQILAYATLTGIRKMSMREISASSGVGTTTCANIIWEAKRRALENGNPDHCTTENLEPRPNASKGVIQYLLSSKNKL